MLITLRLLQNQSGLVYNLNMSTKRKIAIIGSGFTGLAAAHKLAELNKFEIDIYEKESKPGGLAVGFKKPNWDWTIEQAYHHLFTSDHFAINLARQLGLDVILKRPITATYTHNTIIQLDSPSSLLAFPYLTPLEKLKTATTLGLLKFSPIWKPLEKVTAKQWLTKYQGANVWRELWEPLFVGKFGKYADEIAMSWFWARIYKRSASLGYIVGGFQQLAEKLHHTLVKKGVRFHFNTSVTKGIYNQNSWQLTTNNLQLTTSNYDIVIVTAPMPVFLRQFPELPDAYKNKLVKTEHLHALNMLLELKSPFLPSLNLFTRRSLGEGGQPSYPYWLNINDNSMPFLAVVEHTNFMDKKHYGGNHLLYVGNYLPKDHKFFKMDKKALLNHFKPHLLKINPNYNFDFCLLNFDLFVAPFAQPVITPNYSQTLPSLKTPLANLFLGNLDSVYPWDRGTNYAIELGYKLANEVCNSEL